MPYLSSRLFDYKEKQYAELVVLFGDSSVKIAYKGDFEKLKALKALQKVTLELKLNVRNERFAVYCSDIA